MSVTFCRTAPRPGAGRGAPPSARGPGSTTAAVAARARAAGLLPVETARRRRPGARLGGRPRRRRWRCSAPGWPGWRITVRHERPAGGGARRARAAPARPSCAPTPRGSRRRSSSAGCRAMAARVSVPVGRPGRGPRRGRRRGGRPGGRRLGRRRRWPRCATRSPRARWSSAPPCRPGPRSTTPRAELAAAAVHRLARPGRRLGGGAAALPLGAGARRGAARCRRGACRPSGRTRPGARASPRRASGGSAPTWPGSSSARSRARPPRVAEIERLFRGARRRGRGGRPGRRHPARAGAAARRSPTWSTATSTTPTSATSAAASAASRAGPRASTCAATPTSSTVHEVVHRSVEAWERGATEVCLQGGIHPDFTGDFYAGGARGDQGAPARDARPRLHAARGLAGRPHPRGQRARVPHPPARRRPGHPAGHRRRDPRRPGAPAPVPGQGAHRRVGRGDDHRPRARACAPPPRSCSATSTGRAPGPTTSRCCAASSAAPAASPSSCRCRSCTWASPIFLQGTARPGPTWDEVVLVHAVGAHRPRRA